MPDQSNIATKDYPICRTICIIRRSAEFSLGKGIETFIAGEKGQLMFLKQGLPPKLYCNHRKILNLSHDYLS